MGDSLRKRIHRLVRQELAKGEGAWMVWCDPKKQWLGLLQRVSNNRKMGEFALVTVEEALAGQVGGLESRRDLQARLDAKESFVLYVPASTNDLGWLWAQALLAERIYDRSLRAQLQEWGWRPTRLDLSDDAVTSLARERLDQDPGEWGGDSLKPDFDLLIQVLGGSVEPGDETQVRLEITVEAAGLSPVVPGELALWRRKALAQILVTEVFTRAPAALPESHSLLIVEEKRSHALAVLERWCDSLSLAKRLPAAVLAADPLTGLAASSTQLQAGDGPFVSQVAEQAVFANTCQRLAQLNGRTLLTAIAGLAPAIEKHAQGFWGRMASLPGGMAAQPGSMAGQPGGMAAQPGGMAAQPGGMAAQPGGMAAQPGSMAWGELGRLSAAARTLVEEAPAGQWASPDKAILWYTHGGWRLDSAGEELTRTLESTATELVGLIAPLRAAYRALWEETLIYWSQTWSQAQCPMPAQLGSAGEWLKQALESSKRATAVLVLDALRYDIAAVLAQRIDHQEEVARTRIEPARAGFPTITAIGMAMALPMESSRLAATLDDKGWSIREVGKKANLSVAEERRKWWKQYDSSVEFRTLKELHDGHAPRAGDANRRLVIQDATIDRMGHDELDFQGSHLAVQRYVDAIERLRNLDWKRILVVTDHGFIHWTSAEEKNATRPVNAPAWVSRRALACAPEEKVSGPNGLAPGGAWRLAFARGAASFSAHGGLHYFHGGASLQEWIIPCLTVEWPAESRLVTVAIGPLERILSANQRVTLRVSGESLLAEDNIALSVEVVARVAATHAILFRSNKVLARIEAPTLELFLKPEEGAVAVRGTPLRIELRDAQTEEVIDTIESTLAIELSGW